MDMPIFSTDSAVTLCKRQLQVALEIAETVVEAAEQSREIQLAAAVDAHAALEATRKSLDTATTLQQLADVQMQFMTGNFAKIMRYWATLAGNARDAQLRIAGIFAGSLQAGPVPFEMARLAEKIFEKAA